MKIAVIGAGNWGKNLVKTLHHLGHLGPVVDASSANLAMISDAYPDAVTLPDFDSLMDDASIEGVAIATPAKTHHAIAKAFLLAGKDVFVEKPMTLNASDAEDLLQVATAHDRILMTGHLLLYQPAIRFIHDYLRSGQLGTLFSLHQERAKLGRARNAEDVLWSLGVHDVAVLLHLVGSAPLSVSCHRHAGLQPHIADDTYLHLTFAEGVQASLHNSWLWPVDSRCLRIIGSEGMIVYDEATHQVVLHRKTIDSSLQNQDLGTEIVFEGTAQPLSLELQHFVDCITTRQQPISDGRNGLDVIRVLEQASPLA